MPDNYPWTTWFDGEEHEITWLIDFLRFDFEKTMRKAAKRLGVKLHTKRITIDGRSAIRFHTEPADRTNREYLR